MEIKTRHSLKAVFFVVLYAKFNIVCNIKKYRKINVLYKSDVKSVFVVITAEG